MNPSVTAAALAAMDAEGLRDVIRDIIPWLNPSSQARLVNTLVDRAARRNPSGWVPEAPTDEGIAEIAAFVRAAHQVGSADPGEVDEILCQGSNAFLAKNYRAASQIFRHLLPAVGGGEINLGQHELLDEVLGVKPATCAVQYVVASYMISAPDARAQAVLTAIEQVQGLGHYWEPLRDLERVTVEPLPDFDEFLSQWRGLLEKMALEERRSGSDHDEDRWRREVGRRLEGPAGLARIARQSMRSDDLRAWCQALVEAREWEHALLAYDEAAELVTDSEYSRGDFLDGAALAAQVLARKDLPGRLERAWREAPALGRLLRWLGTAANRKSLRANAAAALEACPAEEAWQRGLLHVLLAEFEAASKLLADGPGLGWSRPAHPGHLLFSLFTSLLQGTPVCGSTRDCDEPSSTPDRNEQVLVTPELGSLIELAGVVAPAEGKDRTSMLNAMRRAAEDRIEGVTANQRRRHYGHAAALALTTARIDPRGSADWLARLRTHYRRYPALQRELENSAGLPRRERS